MSLPAARPLASARPERAGGAPAQGGAAKELGDGSLPVGLTPETRDVLIARAPLPARRRLTLGGALRAALFDLLPRLVAIVAVCFAVASGIALRERTFTFTAPVRFYGDISNGLNQGNRVLNYAGIAPKKGERVPMAAVVTAWVKMYDDLYARERPGGYSLDYTPLRLMVMTLWAREVRAEKGAAVGYSDELGVMPLRFNTGCELVAAVGMFLLVAHWRRVSQPRLKLRDAYVTWRGSGWDALARHGPWMVGLLAGTLLWFNPAIIVDAHAFPQWDVWILPFFLFACYAASRNAWVIAGALLALGAMFKGQGLLVAPVIAAWPLLQGRPVAVLRMVMGVAAGVALATWPWLVRADVAVKWMAVASGAAVFLAVAGWALRRRGAWTRHLSMAMFGACAVGAMVYPAYAGGDALWNWTLVGLAAIAAASLWAKPIRALPYVLIGVWSFGALLSAWRFGGSWSWLAIGFIFPTDHYQAPALGPIANFNVILMNNYGWGLKDRMFGTWTLQESMRAVYFATIAPIAVMLAWHARRNSPRALLCMCAPWVLMFAFVPQMHERYLIWGAAITAAAVALGPGYLLLHLAVTTIGFLCVATQVLNTNGRWWPEANHLFNSTLPGLGWATTLLALTYLYLCLIPPRRRLPVAAEAAGSVMSRAA